MVWAEDNRTLFYATRDPVTLRTYRIYRHELGTDPGRRRAGLRGDGRDVLHGRDKSRSRDYIIIGSRQTLANEFRYTSAHRPTEPFRVFLPRERGHEHSLDEIGGYFYIRTNDGATNFRLMRTPVDRTGREHWEEVVPHRDDVYLQGFTLFRDHLVLSERRDGLMQLRVRPWAGDDEHYIAFDEEAYVVFPSRTRKRTRGHPALHVPVDDHAVVDLRLRHGDAGADTAQADGSAGRVRPGGVPHGARFATVRDGTRVPVTLVYRATCAATDRSRCCSTATAPTAQHGPDVLIPAAEPARPRLHLRDRAHPRRAGVRPRVVRGRQAAREEEHVFRLHRCRGAPRRERLHRRRHSSTPRAAARAACSWAPSSITGPTCSMASSPPCRSSMSSRRCSTKRYR
jgi:hypothetical protein